MLAKRFLSEALKSCKTSSQQPLAEDVHLKEMQEEKLQFAKFAQPFSEHV